MTEFPMGLFTADAEIVRLGEGQVGVRIFQSHAWETGLRARVTHYWLRRLGHRDWPLRFFRRERLFSVAARRGYLAPDVAPLAIPAARP